MKVPRIDRSVLASLLWCSVFALFARAAFQQDKSEEFKTKLQAAMKLADADGIAKLVRSYQNEAEVYVLELCVRAPSLSSDDKKIVSSLNDAWQKDFHAAFVNKYFGYFNELGERTRKDWGEANDALRGEIEKFTANMKGSRDSAVWNEIGEASEKLGKTFADLGDGYRSGQAYKMAAIAFDDTYRSDTDKARAASDYAKAVGAYESVEFNLASVQECKTRHQLLSPKQGGDEKKPEGKGGEPKGGDAAGAQGEAGAQVVQLTFQPIEKLDAFQRPHFHTDDVYALWRPLPLGKDKDEQVMTTVEGSPKFRRINAATFEVDFDLDGKFDKQFPVTGKQQLATLTVGKGDAKRDWAFIYTIGLEKDVYQGLTPANLAPNDQQLTIYTAGAASVVGKIGDTAIRVIDDDLNAVYGNWPQAWAHIGLTGKLLQPELDSIVIGDSKRARPWSEYVPIKDQWYKLENSKNGLELKATPVKLELGTLKLDFKGPVQPSWLILRGVNKFENTFIDLAADGKKGVQVPAGEWSLYYGELRKGAKSETNKCLILPGEKNDKLKWVVQPGKEATVKLGEPFQFDFEFETDAKAIKVIGKSVTVVGAAGEHYERTWNCVVHPEAEWRAPSAKKAGKAERFTHVLDINELTSKYKGDWSVLWKPLDLELPLKDKVDKVEVHVFEKKNKFFGFIDSPWKS